MPIYCFEKAIRQSYLCLHPNIVQECNNKGIGESVYSTGLSENVIRTKIIKALLNDEMSKVT